MAGRRDTDPGFEEAFRPLFVLAHRVARRILADPDRAEDIAAEALSRAYAHWASIGRQPYQEAWVVRVAMNLALNDVRRRPPPLPREVVLSEEDAAVNHLLLVEALATVSGRLRLYPYTPSGSEVVAADEWVQVVLTRTGEGTVTGYVDGTEQWQLADTNGVAVIDNEDTLRFFRDNDSGGTTTEHSPGAVARIRVFDRALSATEVRNLGQTPASPCAT